MEFNKVSLQLLRANQPVISIDWFILTGMADLLERLIIRFSGAIYGPCRLRNIFSERNVLFASFSDYL